MPTPYADDKPAGDQPANDHVNWMCTQIIGGGDLQIPTFKNISVAYRFLRSEISVGDARCCLAYGDKLALGSER